MCVCVCVCVCVCKMGDRERQRWRQRQIMLVEFFFCFTGKNYVPSGIFLILSLPYFLWDSFRDITLERVRESECHWGGAVLTSLPQYPLPYFPFLDEKCNHLLNFLNLNSDGHTRSFHLTCHPLDDKLLPVHFPKHHSKLLPLTYSASISAWAFQHRIPGSWGAF